VHFRIRATKSSPAVPGYSLGSRGRLVVFALEGTIRLRHES